jgi:hypothetical protein
MSERVKRKLKGTYSYSVSFAVNTYIDVGVEASSIEEAIQKAEQVLTDMTEEEQYSRLIDGYNASGEIGEVTYVYNDDTGEEWWR